MRHGFRSLVRYFLCCFGLCGITASAQTLQVITLAAHRERLPQLRAAVESCYRDTLLCAAANTITDESFPLSNGVLTHVSYAWLRDGMTALAKAKPEDRKKAADRLLLRLNASDDVKPSPVAAAEARVEADSVLSQVEFAKSKPNILQQQWERFKDWLNQRLTTGSDMRGAVPWLRFLLEAALFGVPLLLLGLWLLRQVREDRLRPSFARDAAKKPAKKRFPGLSFLRPTPRPVSGETPSTRCTGTASPFLSSAVSGRSRGTALRVNICACSKPVRGTAWCCANLPCCWNRSGTAMQTPPRPTSFALRNSPAS